MKHKVLIVESSRLFQNVLQKTFEFAGVECFIFSTGKEALEASHENYTFILCTRTLDDISGEVFLHKYSVEHGLADALTILLTSNEIKYVEKEATNAGYKLVFNKKNLEPLNQYINQNSHVTRVVDKLLTKPDANILLVEDSQTIANMVSKLFHLNKCKVIHVSRITDLDNAFNNNNIDLVITDYYLHEDETGDDVINYVRNLSDTEKSQTPILVVSGETDQTKRTNFLRSGANDFIIKPYDNDELLVRSFNLIENYTLLKQSTKQQRDLMRLALTDQLTGLYNRHSLVDVGPKYISNAHRHDNALSLLVIDLDHFKKINDTKGHSVGDIVLQEVGKTLKNMCRTEDTVARYGGEEFVMILSDCDSKHAEMKADIIRIAIEHSKPCGLVVTSSIGVAELKTNEDFDALFNKADKAVYEAKDTGRNKVVVYS